MEWGEEKTPDEIIAEAGKQAREVEVGKRPNPWRFGHVPVIDEWVGNVPHYRPELPLPSVREVPTD